MVVAGVDLATYFPFDAGQEQVCFKVDRLARSVNVAHIEAYRQIAVGIVLRDVLFEVVWPYVGVLFGFHING